MAPYPHYHPQEYVTTKAAAVIIYTQRTWLYNVIYCMHILSGFWDFQFYIHASLLLLSMLKVKLVAMTIAKINM